jgi:hypothetical protein
VSDRDQRARGPLERPADEALRFRTSARYRREEVFQICDALAVAEDLLVGAGECEQVRQIAALREEVEARLAR